MIDGERGEAIINRLAAMQMDAVVDSDSIMATCVAACFAYALAHEIAPRMVAEQLFQVLPSDQDWDGHLCSKVREVVSRYEDA